MSKCGRAAPDNFSSLAKNRLLSHHTGRPDATRPSSVPAQVTPSTEHSKRQVSPQAGTSLAVARYHHNNNFAHAVWGGMFAWVYGGVKRLHFCTVCFTPTGYPNHRGRLKLASEDRNSQPACITPLPEYSRASPSGMMPLHALPGLCVCRCSVPAEKR